MDCELSAPKTVVDALEAFGLTTPCQVVANACASGTNAIGHAFECVRSGHYDRILAGGYDALSELVFVGFDSLQAATPEKCRPFDAARSGLVLGEGAALLALENLEQAEARGTEILAEIAATAFPPTTIISPNRIPPELAHARPWNGRCVRQACAGRDRLCECAWHRDSF
jgi:3-oxoacyl-[acyl-carrier-protein] synthase II